MGNAAKEIQVNPRECRICIENYDPVTRRPRFLPCGHTFCTECIDDMLEDCVLTCPNCRAEHKAFKVDDFPVAAIVEDFMMYCLFLEEGKIPEFEPEKSADSLDDGNSENGSLCRVLDTLRNEELACSRTLISSCNEMLSELTRYRSFLLKYEECHEKDRENFNNVIELHNAALDLIGKEIMEVDTLKEKGTKKKEVLLSAVNSLLSAKTSEEVESAIVRVDNHQHAVEKWFHKCSIFPDHDAICLSVKLRKATSVVFETLCSWMDGEVLGWKPMDGNAKSISNSELKQKTKEPECLKDFTAGLMEKFQHYHIRYQSVITAESINAYVEAGHSVYTVKYQKDGFLFGRFSESSGNIFMHCLQDQAPTRGVYTIPFSEVKATHFHSGWKAFFDITWPDSPPRRVIIHLVSSYPTDHTRVMFMLCTGEKGRSYINSGVDVIDGEMSSEHLIFGKGCRSPATFSTISRGRLVNDKVGFVDVSEEGQVHITINPGISFCTTVGNVCSGMDVLQEASEYYNTSKVQLVDCGVVLPC